MALFRRAVFFLVLFGAGVAVAWVVLPRFVTPEEAEAVREPPPPEPVTAPVEVGVLREVLVLDGEVRPRVEIRVDPWEPAGASRSVVTYPPEPGSEIRSGHPVVGLSGRPLIFVSGMSNLYRDLHRGLVGSDVDDLQSTLLVLGYLKEADEVDGVFGATTETAVAAWYENIGFDPAPPPEEVTTVSVLEAKNALDQAEQALADARKGGSSTAVATARRSLAIADAQLDALQRAPVLTLPADEILGLPYETLIVEGSPYRQGDLVDVDQPLVRLRTPETLVVASATSAQTSEMSEGQPVVVFIGDREIASSVGRIVAAEPESATGAFVRIDTDAGDVPPGTPVRVEVELKASDGEVVSVPVSAVRTDADGSSHVTVVDGDNQTEVEVEPGVTIGGRTEIVSGLDGGELVVVG